MKTKSKNKQGISLIVLVITIIVMIILAAAIILSLSSNGLIDRANEAVEKTDKAQVKVQASTIWAEEYLELKEGNITQEQFISVVKDRINKEIEKSSKYDIEVTLKGVAVEEKAKTEWVEIMTTPVSTQDGGAMVSENNIFIDGYTYRITVEGPVYNGQFICKALYSPIEGVSANTYSLIDIGSVEQPLWETYSEAYKLSQDNIKFMVQAAYVQDEGSGIIFNETEDVHTITKIEGLKPKTVYKNENATNLSETIEIEELNVDRSYIIEYNIDGNKYYAEQFATVGDLEYGDVTLAALYTMNNSFNTIICNGKMISVEAPVSAIYDIGKNPSGIYYENGFCILESSINKFTGEIRTGELLDTPLEDCTIPESVSDIKVESLPIGNIKCRVATIIRDVNIEQLETTVSVQKIIIKNTAKSLLEQGIYVVEIDVTDFGDEVQLSQSWLETDETTIYVTANAKKNLYASKTNVVAVE